MSWVALIDQNSRLRHAGFHEDQELRRGTLMFETTVAPHGTPQTLIAAQSPRADQGELSVQAFPGGGIHFLLQSHGDILHTAISHDAEDQSDVLRISYSWDLANRFGAISIERPGTLKLFRRIIEPAMPISAQIIKSLLSTSGQSLLDPAVKFIALSNEVEPVGPMPSICASSPVQTPYGQRPAGELQRGDLVMTLSGTTVPVLQTLRRTVPARGAFRPVKLRAPYFGLQQDIVVTPEAHLVVGGSQVEYLFGSEGVLVPVKHLTSAASATFISGRQMMEYVQLLLPDHEAIFVGGTALESLNIGRLRRKKDMVPHTMLGKFDPATLPEHSKSAYPVLKQFEAVTLAQLRAA